MDKKLKAISKVSVALLGTAGFVAAAPQVSVQAAAKYQVYVSKKAYVYTSKGKKTKKSYKKAKLTVYGTKTIKGKKYYSLGKGRYIRTSDAKKDFARYSYSTQTKKITRTIKLYQPKGEKKVIQKAYIKRSVKTDNKTKKKTYGKWSTSSWKKYTATKVEGYTASRSSIGAVKVTYKLKNQTVKVTYKKNATAAKNNPASDSKTTDVNGKGNSSVGNTNSSSNSKTTDVSGKGNSSAGNTNSTLDSKTSNVSDKGNSSTTKNNSSSASKPTNSGSSSSSSNSSSSKNTISVKAANFNVKRNVSATESSQNIDMFALNSDGTFSKKKSAATAELFEGNYYPIVYHVLAMTTDKSGVKWYKIADPQDNNSSAWVKADGFTTTTIAAGSTRPTYDEQAKADYDKYKKLAEELGSLEAAQNDLNQKKAALDSANQAYTAAETSYNNKVSAAKASYDEASSAYEAAGYDFIMSKATANYYQDSKTGMANVAVLSGYVNGLDDSVKSFLSTSNLKKDVTLIKELNSFRASDNNFSNHNALGVDYDLMVYASIAGIISNSTLDHTYFMNNPENVDVSNAENLAWGYSDPLSGWYTKEKAIYDAHGSGITGHYTNCMGDYDYVGLVLDQNSKTSAADFNRNRDSSTQVTV
ncbi:SLAP domain-containing protein, partial [Lactobacillus sp. 23-2]|uniref:mucin-binding protein n=1 Tax=Lactobacillus sp. 23-2 TaxID=2981842 RepID=UPI003834AAED